MLVICEECGKKYQIDPDKIKGEQASFACKACNHRIVVTKPAAEPLDPTPEPPAPEPTPPSAPPPPDVVVPARSGGRRFGIAAKAMALMLCLCMGPLLVYWAITFRQNSDRIKLDTARLSSEISRSLVNTVDEWIDKNLRVLSTFAAIADIQAMESARQEPLLKAIAQQYPWMYLVFTVDPEGMNLARNDGNPLTSYADRQYYKDIMAGKPIAWQALIGKTSKKPALVLAVPIKRGEQVVGVLATAMTIEDISKHIVNWRQGDTGMAFLLDEKGKVIVHRDAKLVAEQADLSGHPLVAAFRNGQRGNVGFTLDGRPYIGHVDKTGLGWMLGLVQEEGEAFQALQQIQVFSWLFLAVIFGIGVVAALISSRQMARPILSLTEAADRISVGELDFAIVVNRNDEIGDLAEAMKRMQDSLRLSIERLRRRR